MNDKIENLNNVLKAKDEVIDQILNEISTTKNGKDEIQNELLFTKQKVDTLNMDFNSREMEYQRLWEEDQDLRKEIRGETTDASQVKRQNEFI